MPTDTPLPQVAWDTPPHTHWTRPRTFPGSSGGDAGSPSGEVAQDAVHRLVVLQKPGPDEAAVEHLGAVPRKGRHAPQQEEALGSGGGIAEGPQGEDLPGKGRVL